jgi:hypothetical protein
VDLTDTKDIFFVSILKINYLWKKAGVILFEQYSVILDFRYHGSDCEEYTLVGCNTM